MGRILVYDVAAESGGALSVLLDYYKKAKNDKSNEYVFVVSVVDIKGTDNIEVINLPWVKKSWFHRLYCDSIYIKKMIKRLSISEILSLQNNAVSVNSVHQTVYVHNAIPFTEIRFSLLKEPFLWVYQNIIGRIIKRTLLKCDKIIVQTNWMKSAIAEQVGINENCIEVIPISGGDTKGKQATETSNTFFYPASSQTFKNHKVIVEACKAIQTTIKYKVVFTIKENENNYTKKLAKECQKNAIPIEFVGMLTKEDVEKYYRQSILIFPSLLETVGLPLVEAQKFNSTILAADCEYAHDAVGKYNNVVYFDPRDYKELANKMLSMVNK